MRQRLDPSLLVVAAGVAAAMHVGKLPPALPALHDSLGVTLVQGGFLISLVQLAGMSLGLFVGLAADALGLRRTLVSGLVLLSLASALSALVTHAWMLLALRGLEGMGFLLAVTPAPGLVRRLVPPEHLSLRLGLWGSFMPVGTALALLVGPGWIDRWGWPSWWWLTAALSGVMAACLLAFLPADPVPGATAPRGRAWQVRLAQTLRTPGPWLIAFAFAAYSAQWLAVIGFLPTIYAQAGVAPAVAGVATAVAAAANVVGNVTSGRMLQRGVAPQRLLQVAFVAMGLGGLLAFAPLAFAGPWVAALVPYAAVLCFSAMGGLIPATLFSLAVRLAPGADTVSTTVGWMQQWSALGQFAGPPLVAWVASQGGGWGFSGVVIAVFALVGLAFTPRIGRLCRPPAQAAA